MALRLGEVLTRARDTEGAAARLRSVTAGLPADDELARAAAMRLASLEAAAGRRDEAARLFATTGLAADQCALVDQAPVVLRRSSSSSDFPSAAYGFNAWVVTEYDIDAAGRTRNARPIFSYPPFIFNDSATRIVGRSVYQPTFRPAGGLGCGGYRDQVHFRSRTD